MKDEVEKRADLAQAYLSQYLRVTIADTLMRMSGKGKNSDEVLNLIIAQIDKEVKEGFAKELVKIVDEYKKKQDERKDPENVMRRLLKEPKEDPLDWKENG